MINFLNRGVLSQVERRRSGLDTQPNPEVTARRPRRRFTSSYKLEVLRKADACTQPGQLGRCWKEGLYSSHLVTWRKQRVAGLTPQKRGRKVTVDPRVKQLEREQASLEATTRRLERRLQRADTIIAFQKKVAELLGIPLEPIVTDEID